MKHLAWLLVIVLSACNGSPTAPTPTPPPVATTPPPVVTPTPPPPPPLTYAGRWSGQYTVEQCAGSSGSMDDVLCSSPRPGNAGGLFQRGVILPMVLDLSQTGNAVSGTLTLGQLRGPVSGSVVNNVLVLTGSATYSDASVGLSVTSTITQWDTAVTNNELRGTFTLGVRVNVLPGDGLVQVRLSNVRR